MKQVFIFSLLSFVVFSCSEEKKAPISESIIEKENSSGAKYIKEKVEEKTEITEVRSNQTEYQTRTFQNENATWGYDLLRSNAVFIHQANIPSIPGLKGFSTKEEAQKVAEFVMNKLNKNIMPPSVTPEELKSLGIKF